MFGRIFAMRWNKADLPHKGLTEIGMEDLGEGLEGEEIEYEQCEMCGNEKIRYVHIMKGKKVILLVDTRKMRCMNPDCSHKTFSEKHPFVTAKSKKTNRLIKNILYTSSQLSSLNASKLLKSENITVCKSSICDLLKKNAIHCG